MTKTIILSAVAALCLAACGDTETATEAPAAAKADTPETTAGAAFAAGTMSRDAFIGKWAEESDGDCALAQDFKADGTVDGVVEGWAMEGDTLTLTIMGETQTMTVAMVDATHVDVTRDGETRRLVRC